MSLVIGIGVILVGSSCPKELARELIGVCFFEERTTMLVDVVVDNIVNIFKSTTDWNIVVLVFVDNGRMILLPIRSWIFHGCGDMTCIDRY